MASLGNDLATLRNKKRYSLDDIEKATKIPTRILTSIENDSIFKQMDNNTTYVRSYVRSYAKAIGIREKQIVRALNQVQQQSYDGGLLPDKQKELTETEQKDEEKSVPSENQDQPKQDQPKKEPPKQQPAKSEQSTGTRSKPPSSARSTDNWDWVQVGQRAKTTTSNSPARTGILILLILIAAVAAGFVIYTFYYADNQTQANQPASNESEQPATPSDSLRQALLNENNENEPVVNDATGELPDTLTVALHAAGGQLNPIRVYTDISDSLNPHWIPQGDTLRFNFVNALQIRAEQNDQPLLDRLQILFNNHVIQNYYQEYYNPETERIELNRSLFENHPEWRRPANQSPAP